MLRNIARIKPVRFSSTTARAAKTTRASMAPIVIGGAALAAGVYLGTQLAAPSTKISTSTTPLATLPPPVYATDAEFNAALVKIQNILPAEDISASQSELDAHSDTYFNSHHATPDQRPSCVLYPSTSEQVSQILAICNEYRIPVVPFSGGTSLEGHFTPTRRPGVCIDMSKHMNNIIKLNERDLDIVVQPGVSWEDLDEFLQPYGLMFSSDPGPGALIGGIVANNASGTNCSRYGATKENVLSLQMALADGTVIRTKKRPKKSSAGYNLNGLFIGSEGTLGICTEATLKLHVRPKEVAVAVASFNTIEDAANTVSELVAAGIQPNAVELLDADMMRVVNLSGETSRTWLEKPTLFFKLGGSSGSMVKEMINSVKNTAKTNKMVQFEFAKSEEERLELWSARKTALWSTINYGRNQHPDTNVWTTDVAVPVSRLPELLHQTKEDIDSTPLKATMVAHAADGNFHAFILYKPDERDIAEGLVDRMVSRAIKMEGTCTGEHGVGMGKREFLVEEVGEDVVDVMRRVKLALDPERIMNPDKVFKIDPHDCSH